MKADARIKAVDLRRQQWTYAEIAKELNVSKGILSLWLRDIAYSPRPETLERKRQASIRNGDVLRTLKRKRLISIYADAKAEIGKLGRAELWLFGVLAYWAEGSKTIDSLVKFTNTDPDLVLMMVKWLKDICLVQPRKFRFHLRLHPGENVKELERFWSQLTGIPKEQFYRTTLKVSGSGGKTIRKLKHGIASVIVCDTALFHRIHGWIEGVRSQFGSPIVTASVLERFAGLRP